MLVSLLLGSCEKSNADLAKQISEKPVDELIDYLKSQGFQTVLVELVAQEYCRKVNTYAVIHRQGEKISAAFPDNMMTSSLLKTPRVLGSCVH